MNKRLLILITAMCLMVTGKGQQIEPPFWWTQMPVQQLQLMVHHDEIASYTATLDYPGVILKRQIKGDSPNYVFLYLELSTDVKPGTFDIIFSRGRRSFSIAYTLKTREEDLLKNQGFSSEDVIYLLMPDRFANGDTENDAVAGMLEAADRTQPNGRHGGDIRGIEEHLDYIKEMGMTAVWLTPVFENDMTPEYGAYHGYAATDLYRIDRRFGSNEEFREFVRECHRNGLKVIMDMIHNHIGDQHPWMSDLPTRDWVHDREQSGLTSYRGVVQSDPYASDHDLARLEQGWFVDEMPDLDQRNPLLADYLIQNTLWWIEYSGIDGIRMDTYVYPYKTYMARWAREVMEAYPELNIVGEAWVETVTHESYWQEDLPGQDDGYNSYLPNVTDFQFHFAINNALNTDYSWTGGLMHLYYYLSQDRLYSDPMKNVIFLDNHDTERFFTSMGESPEKYKMGYAVLLTMRGIPQLYYGSELMWANANTPHDSRKRADMPGGWPGDERSVFTETGRNNREQEAFAYVSALANWRKTSEAVQNGALTHFVPEDNIYVYFRHTTDESVMVVVNGNREEKVLSNTRFAEMFEGYSKAVNVLNGTTIDISRDFPVPGMSTSVFELE